MYMASIVVSKRSIATSTSSATRSSTDMRAVRCDRLTANAVRPILQRIKRPRLAKQACAAARMQPPVVVCVRMRGCDKAKLCTALDCAWQFNRLHGSHGDHAIQGNHCARRLAVLYGTLPASLRELHVAVVRYEHGHHAQRVLRPGACPRVRAPR